MDANDYHKAVKLLEEGEVIEDNAEADIRINRAIEIGENLAKAYPDNADYYQFLGYCWYVLRNNTKERDEKIKFYLDRALELDPKHLFARLYLGHYYFDKADYKNALDNFLLVIKKDFFDIKQNWRVIKLEELILSCRLNLNPEKVDVFDITELTKLYQNNDEEDRPVPAELAKYLNQLISSGQQSRLSQSLYDEIVKFFDSTGYKHLLSLQG